MEFLRGVDVGILEYKELPVRVLQRFPDRIPYRTDRGLVPATRIRDRTATVPLRVFEELTEWAMDRPVHLVETEDEFAKEIEGAQAPLTQLLDSSCVERCDVVNREILYVDIGCGVLRSHSFPLASTTEYSRPKTPLKPTNLFTSQEHGPTPTLLKILIL